MFTMKLRKSACKEINRKQAKLERLNAERKKFWEKYNALKLECQLLESEIKDARSTFDLDWRRVKDEAGNLIEGKDGEYRIEYYIPDEPEKEDEYI